MAWVIVTAGMVILAGLPLALFVRSERRRGRRVLSLAEAQERQGRYGVACYYYAVAAAAGEARDTCEAKIRELWRRHGPFELAEAGREVHETYCRSKSCGQGFHELTVRDILRVVGANAERGAT